MSDPQIIFRYFPELDETQRNQIEQLFALYTLWNAQINVISRKDMEQFYERHVLHSLSIAKLIKFAPGTRILDVGTGGGFPGIPLAILFPQCQFHLVDSIGKKIKVVNEVSRELGLSNVTASHSRVEDIKGKFHFVVNRAVAAMPLLVSWVRNHIAKEQLNAIPNGIISLKGGDLSEEMEGLGKHYDEFPISQYFSEPFFETKKLIVINL
jgi:16S rRNA (guanine527-N7)-methyltransferase